MTEKGEERLASLFGGWTIVGIMGMAVLFGSPRAIELAAWADDVILVGFLAFLFSRHPAEFREATRRASGTNGNRPAQAGEFLEHWLARVIAGGTLITIAIAIRFAAPRAFGAVAAVDAGILLTFLSWVYRRHPRDFGTAIRRAFRRR